MTVGDFYFTLYVDLLRLITDILKVGSPTTYQPMCKNIVFNPEKEKSKSPEDMSTIKSAPIQPLKSENHVSDSFPANIQKRNVPPPPPIPPKGI